LTADNVGDIWALAAGGAGALADNTAVAVAGSVSLNTIGGHTRARMLDSNLTFAAPEPDRQSSEKVLSLAYGDTVRIDNGTHAGDVYVFVGSDTAASHTYNNSQRPAQVTNGQIVLRLAGVGNSFTDDALFKYVGTAPLENTVDPDAGVLLDAQNY